MFKKILLDFLLSAEASAATGELDEWYLSDFDDKYVNSIDYETGYAMLIDCCEVWIEYPRFTFELIYIIGSIRNIISTNTFPKVFIDNKDKILTIYKETEARVTSQICEKYSDIKIKQQLLEKIIKQNIQSEKDSFQELFHHSNINWFDI